MPDVITILLVDDNTAFCSLLKEYLDRAGGMSVAGIAENGEKALEKIRSLGPDVVVFDIIMPELDGIGILERMQDVEPEKRPVFIALTAIGKDRVVRRAIELGADYFLVKPFDEEMLAKHIRRLHAEKKALRNVSRRKCAKNGGEAKCTESRKLELVIADLVKSVGITPNMAGYHYLKEAVILAVNRPVALKSVAKLIYPVLAENHNTTVRSVDKAIRSAVDSACKKMKSAGIGETGDAAGEQNCFMYIGGSRPGNAQLISFLAAKAEQALEGRSGVKIGSKRKPWQVDKTIQR